MGGVDEAGRAAKIQEMRERLLVAEIVNPETIQSPVTRMKMARTQLANLVSDFGLCV